MVLLMPAFVAIGSGHGKADIDEIDLNKLTSEQVLAIYWRQSQDSWKQAHADWPYQDIAVPDWYPIEWLIVLLREEP